MHRLCDTVFGLRGYALRWSVGIPAKAVQGLSKTDSLNLLIPRVMSNTITATVAKQDTSNITFPVFLKDKGWDAYTAFFSRQHKMSIALFGDLCDITTHKAFSIDLYPKEEALSEMVLVGKDEFETALREAQSRQLKIYQEYDIPA